MGRVAYIWSFVAEIQVCKLSGKYPVKRNSGGQAEAEVPVVNLD